LAIHQQTTDELGGDDFGRAGEEGLRECWEGLDGYGSGLGRNGWSLLGGSGDMLGLHHGISCRDVE